MVLAGIMAWQIEQSFVKGLDLRRTWRCMGSSMIWGSGIVVWDDEAIELINQYFNILIDLDWTFYVTAGFGIDILRSKITKK